MASNERLPPFTDVVLDSTAIYQDFHLKQSATRRVLQAANKGWLRVHVPEVVIRETDRHYGDRSSELSDAARKLARSALVTSTRLPFDVDEFSARVASAREDYARTLRTQLTGQGVSIIPVPEVPINALLDRDIRSRRPFDETGRGFRDALVWESVLVVLKEAHPEGRVAFVTANVRDFGGDGSYGLHPDLDSELQDRAASGFVVRFDSIRACTDALDVRDLWQNVDEKSPLGSVKTEISHSIEHVREKLEAAVSEVIDAPLTLDAATQGAIPADLPLKFDLMDPTFRWFNSTYVPDVDSAQELLDGSFELEISTQGTLSVGMLTRPELLRKSNYDYEIIDMTEGGLAEVVIEVPDVWLYFWVEWDPVQNRVTAVEVSDAWHPGL